MKFLAIDQGTTSSRAIVYDQDGSCLAQSQHEITQIYPRSGWVEHDPEEIWSTTLAVCRDALNQVAVDEVAAIGITNQRETTVMWERASGRPVYNAIVWQDRRGADQCDLLKRNGEETGLIERTGLVADSYFSATKAAWLLDRCDPSRARAARGELACGTIDSFLIWRLTGGAIFATDATNASRTLLFNIHDQDWDRELLEMFNVPIDVLADVRDCAADFGSTKREIFGRSIPITGVAGDQQAAGIGQACFSPGMVKATLGTGCFVLANAGKAAPMPKERLLTTVAYRLDDRVSYAVEGSIFNAGTAVQWLRDQLGLIDCAEQSEILASSLDDTEGVYFVPAFTGLGAPWWDPDARGLICGLGRDTGANAIVRAALEAVAYQLNDLVQAMSGQDGLTAPTVIRVDGGMATNDWLMQFLADILSRIVERPADVESTARGAALLAGLGVGCYTSTDDIAALWPEDVRYQPMMDAKTRRPLIDGWHGAVRRTLTDTRRN